jgi:hypothetical protein
MQRLGENADTQEEVEWGSKMCAERSTFLQRLTHAEAEKKKADESGGAGSNESKG